jgi:lauroyl/myristoyl acyltransferase
MTGSDYRIRAWTASADADRRAVDPRSAAFEATIRFCERLVRPQPAQWLIFDDMWPPSRSAAGEQQLADARDVDQAGTPLEPPLDQESEGKQ